MFSSFSSLKTPPTVLQSASGHRAVRVSETPRRWSAGSRWRARTCSDLPCLQGHSLAWLASPINRAATGSAGEFCQGSDYMRVNLSKNLKLSKKKKRLHSALPWAYVNSSHSQTSRNVWGGKLFPSSEACLAPSRTAPTCNECAPGPLCTTY